MRIFTILTVMLLFVFGTAQATQPADNVMEVSVKGPSDVQIKKLVQYMTKTYNLSTDQQVKVKEAAQKMATDASAQKPIDANERTMLRDAFSVTMSNALSGVQYTQYKSELSTKINPLLDAVIDAAAK